MKSPYWLLALFVFLLLPLARPAEAQYMWLDSNGDGVNTAADRLNDVGVATTVDVYLDTNNNKDGSVALCDTHDSTPNPDDLDINSYVVNLELTGGTANFTNFINEQAGMTTVLFPAASTSTQASFANGSGTFLAPGTYFLMRVTCTLLTNGGATLNPVGSALSPDPTLFGTHCSGNDFLNSYQLGPNDQGATPDWTDTAGLGAPATLNTAPTVANPGPKSTNEGVLLSYTVTATDPDAAQTVSFTLGAGAPTGAAITAGGNFTWTPTEAQGPGTFPVTYVAADNFSPPATGSATNTITVNEVNLPPVVANPGNKTTDENVALAYTVTATDPDVPPNTLNFSLGAGAPAGAAITTGGNFSWTPTESQGPGTFPVTYTATDGGSPPLSGSTANTITVNEVNQAPIVTNPGAKTGNVGVLISYTVTASDADIPANTVTFTLGAGAPTGAAITAGGAFTWTPAAGQTGAFPVTYTATDNGTPPLSGSATNTITVSPGANGAPVVTNPGPKATNEGVLLAYTVTATDPDVGQTVTFTLGAGAPAGAAITAGGNFTWTPTEAQGPGTFPVTYVATDNFAPPATGTATNTITVNEVNLAPVVTAPANQTVNEGVLVSYTVTATDPDLPANTFTFALAAGAPAGAAITAGGNFTWTPSEAQGPGTFPITYNATDNGTPPATGSASNTITVTEVNTAPVVTNPGPKTAAVASLLTYTVTATDADLPAQTLTFTLGAGAPAGAAITAGGVFSWTPPATGTFPVTYIATDNGTPPMNGSATNTITVLPGANTAPTVANPGNKTTDELALLSYTVTATDADVPAQTLTFSLGAGAPAGAAITAGGAFTWTPTEAQGPGTFPVTYNATDDGTPPLTGSATNTITVNEVNVAPVVANPGNKAASTGVLLTYTVTATDADLPAQTLTFTLGAGAPAGAAITAGGVFSWTPSPGQSGDFPVTYVATDNGTPPLSGSATNTITVGSLNSAPVVTAPANQTVNEGTLVSYTVTATDPDSPPNAFTFALGAGAPAGAAISAAGAFTWTPTEAQGPGTYPITYEATDDGTPPLTGSATNTITVNEVNAAPVVTAPADQTVDEGTLVSYTVTATDADLPAQTLTFALGAGAPAGAAITAGGAFTWTPSEAQGPGTYPITYEATDNGTPPLSGSATNTITVNEANNAPVVTAPANQTVSVGALVSYTVTASDSDTPAQSLTFSLGAGAPAGAAITAGGDFTWTPSAGQTGAFPVTYTATDNGTPPLSGSATNTITVNGVNQAPTLVQPADMTLAANTTADQGLTGSDPDGDALTFSKVSGPVFMTVTTLTPTTGNIHLAPASADAGNYPVNTVRASDGTLSDDKSFAIDVTPAENQAPTADAGGPYTGSVGTPVQFDGSGSSDPDGDALTYAWDFGDAGTGVGVAPSHTYAAVGLYNVTLRVTDTGGLFGDDGTTANIVDQFSAFAFPQSNNKIKLNTGKPQYCFQIQPVDGSYNNTDVDLNSIVMISPGTGSVDRIPASGSKTTTNGDLNNDGILEIRACFTRNDLRLLFSELGSGTHTVHVALEGSLISGGEFHAELDLAVSGTQGNAKNSGVISPNPLNPQAVLTFSTSKAGAVKVQMFDIRGRLVRTLEDTQSAPAGYHDVTIDGMNSSGVRLASGRYFVLVSSSDGTEKLSVTILK